MENGSKLVSEGRVAASLQRTIAAMPVVVNYRAHLGLVKQSTVGGETIFETGTRETDSQGRPTETWTEAQLDPYLVKIEFHAVRTERQALDFLRHNGTFSPLSREVSWRQFQRWQRFVEIAEDRDALASEHLAVLPTEGDVREVLKAFAGYPHKFFHVEERSYSEAEQRWMEDPQIRASVQQGAQFAQAKQRELEQWFIRPPVDIAWTPKILTGDMANRLSKGGALPELIASKDAITPAMLIVARTALTAIAGAIYADRVAQVEYKICKGCRKRFEPSSAHHNKFCEKRCYEAWKKRDQRSKPKEAKDGKA